MGLCVSSPATPAKAAEKTPEKGKTTPTQTKGTPDSAKRSGRLKKGGSPIQEGVSDPPQSAADAEPPATLGATPTRRTPHTPRTKTPRGQRGSDNSPLYGRGSEAGSVNAHPVSNWGDASDMAESTDMEDPSPSPLTFKRHSADAAGTPTRATPPRSSRVLFEPVPECFAAGTLVHLELTVASDERVLVRLLTADGAAALDLQSIHLESTIKDLASDPILASLMAIKILPPASPESEARGWDAAGASAAGAEAPYVDADGIERPSTPPLDATKKTPEKGPSPPSPPQPRLGGREALEAGMDTPDHRSSLRAVQLRSPGSVGGYNPPPPNTLVLYTTSLRVVRKAHHDSCLARGLLDTFCYVYVERDVSMSRQFQDELKRRLPDGFGPSVPCLYFGDVFVGDYPHICRLAEAGDFDYALDCLGARRRDVAPPSCQWCNSLRFVMCPTCRGAHKVPGPPPTDEIELRYYDPNYPEMIECPDCNENGMVQCECTLGSPQLTMQRVTEGESPM